MEKHERYFATEHLLVAVSDLGLRQDWIAEQVKMPKSSLSRVLRGLRAVDRQKAEDISTLLRVPFFVGWMLPIRSEETREGIAA